MVRQFEKQTHLLTCLATRLIPWLLLSLVAIGAGCEPYPWIQIDFQFPDGKSLRLHQIDAVITITDGNNNGHTWSPVASFNDQALNQGNAYFPLPHGTRGKLAMSLTATIAGPPDVCYTAQTSDSISVKIAADRSSPIVVLFTERKMCLPKMQGLALDGANQNSESVEIYTDRGLDGL